TEEIGLPAGRRLRKREGAPRRIARVAAVLYRSSRSLRATRDRRHPPLERGRVSTVLLSAPPHTLIARCFSRSSPLRGGNDREWGNPSCRTFRSGLRARSARPRSCSRQTLASPSR